MCDLVQNEKEGKFIAEELKIINQLISHVKKPTKIEDLFTNITYNYNSISEAGRALFSDFQAVDNEKKGISIIMSRLSGVTKNPIYKGRFRFERADSKDK